MEDQSIFYLFSTLFLIAASYQDFKTRYVSDQIWIAQSISGVLLLLFFLLGLPRSHVFHYLFLILLNSVTSIIIAMFLYNSNSWGGADSKCIIALSLTNPLLNYESSDISIINVIPPVIFLLFNLSIILVSYSIFLFLANSFHWLKTNDLFSGRYLTRKEKIGILFFGLRVNGSIENKISHIKILETINSYNNFNLKQKQIFPMTDEDFEMNRIQGINNVSNKLACNYNKFIWIKPLPPGIVIIFFSFLLFILIGSPLEQIIFLYLSIIG